MTVTMGKTSEMSIRYREISETRFLESDEKEGRRIEENSNTRFYNRSPCDMKYSTFAIHRSDFLSIPFGVPVFCGVLPTGARGISGVLS